jgi:ribosome-associated protein
MNAENQEQAPKSKSQIKRDMHALQDLGAELIVLSKEQLQEFDLPEELLRAVLETKRITSGSAKKRQLQYLGKLMRKTDPEPIRIILDKLKNQSAEAARELHTLEKWRERLIKEGKPALTEFISAYPHADSQRMRQMLKEVEKDLKKENNSGASKKLFRHLREIIKGQ